MNRENRRKIQKKAEKVYTLSQRIDTLGGLSSEAAVAAAEVLNNYVKTLSFEELLLIDEYIIEKYGTPT